VNESFLIKNARVVTPTAVLERGWLFARDGKIRLMGTGAVPDVEADATLDANGLTLLPGFIDVHVHGGVGCEVMDASPDSLRSLAEFYATRGVSSFLATTWTDSHERIMAALEVIAELKGPQPEGATVLGAHSKARISTSRSRAHRTRRIFARRTGRRRSPFSTSTRSGCCPSRQNSTKTPG
jgi:N-acetylglucosamine-6-phosphate deacetylase